SLSFAAMPRIALLLRLVLGLTLALRLGHLLELALAHRLVHALRCALEVALLLVSALGGKGGAGRLLLRLRFRGHGKFLPLLVAVPAERSPPIRVPAGNWRRI